MSRPDIHVVGGPDELQGVLAELDQVHAAALQELRAAIRDGKHFALITGDTEAVDEGVVRARCSLIIGGLVKASSVEEGQLRICTFLRAAMTAIDRSVPVDDEEDD